MQTLFPQIKPYARHELAVEEPHVLYIDESGSPDGLPVVLSTGAGIWLRRQQPLLFRSQSVPHHHVRSARLRAFDSPREPG